MADSHVARLCSPPLLRIIEGGGTLGAVVRAASDGLTVKTMEPKKMLARIAIVFAGVLICGVALNLYYLVFCFFTVFLLGIEDASVLKAQYWLCFAGGVATAFFVMRRVWLKEVNSKDTGTIAETETPPPPSR